MARGPLRVGRSGDIPRTYDRRAIRSLAKRRGMLAAALKLIAKEDPEIARLAHVRSPWEVVIRLLEQSTAGGPRTLQEAQAAVGAEVPMTMADEKPRDDEGDGDGAAPGPVEHGGAPPLIMEDFGP